jgi:outer membrane scaffolding protein for murein synthesis (MipA/OmpV family)
MKKCLLRGKLVWILGVVISMCLISNGFAQDIEMPAGGLGPEEGEARGIYEVGLGAGIAPEYEGSEDSKAYPLPYVSLRFENNMSLDWIANLMRFNLIPSTTFKAGPIAQYIAERDNVENKRVDDLEKVDAAFMVGGFLGFEVNRFTASAEAMTDVADANEGAIVRLRAGYRIPISRNWIIGINGFTTWADEDYMEAYFGVDRRNSLRSGIKQFEADSGFKDVGVTVPIRYNATECLSVIGVAGFKMLIGDAEDSPIVSDEGEENQFYGGAFVIYGF